jgi:hypothetical protein
MGSEVEGHPLDDHADEGREGAALFVSAEDRAIVLRKLQIDDRCELFGVVPIEPVPTAGERHRALDEREVRRQQFEAFQSPLSRS